MQQGFGAGDEVRAVVEEAGWRMRRGCRRS